MTHWKQGASAVSHSCPASDRFWIWWRRQGRFAVGRHDGRQPTSDVPQISFSRIAGRTINLASDNSRARETRYAACFPCARAISNITWAPPLASAAVRRPRARERVMLSVLVFSFLVLHRALPDLLRMKHKPDQAFGHREECFVSS